MTKATPYQTKAYSEIRDVIEVKEIPIIKIRFKMLTTDRVIDAKKLGIDSDAFKNMPEHIQTKLKQRVIPNSAVRPLDSIRKNVDKYMNDVGSKHELFGFVLGHEKSIEVEEKLLKFQSDFNQSIMAKDDYDARCLKILDSFRNDADLKKYPWYSTFIDAIVASQPSWEKYFESCGFEIHPFYIGESGSTSAHKFKSAKDSFKEICRGTKGNLIQDISKTAMKVFELATKNGPQKGIKEVTWKQLIKICDKLQSLSFVSHEISNVEAEIRGILSKVLPNAGDIYGIQRENLLSILSMLVDPFKLADKVENGTAIFENVDISLDFNSESKLKQNIEEVQDELIDSVAVLTATEENVRTEAIDDTDYLDAASGSESELDATAETLNDSDTDELSNAIVNSISADEVVSDLALEAVDSVNLTPQNAIVFHTEVDW